MDPFDDFETAGDKPKKPARVPFKKLADDALPAAGSGGFALAQSKPDSRKTSDVVDTPIVRKTSDVPATAPKKASDVAPKKASVVAPKKVPAAEANEAAKVATPVVQSQQAAKK